MGGYKQWTNLTELVTPLISDKHPQPHPHHGWLRIYVQKSLNVLHMTLHFLIRNTTVQDIPVGITGLIKPYNKTMIEPLHNKRDVSYN